MPSQQCSAAVPWSPLKSKVLMPLGAWSPCRAYGTWSFAAARSRQLCHIWMYPLVIQHSYWNWRIDAGFTMIWLIYGYLWWIYPLNMVIFHSHVSLPEGNWTSYGNGKYTMYRWFSHFFAPILSGFPATFDVSPEGRYHLCKDPRLHRSPGPLRASVQPRTEPTPLKNHTSIGMMKVPTFLEK